MAQSRTFYCEPFTQTRSASGDATLGATLSTHQLQTHTQNNIDPPPLLLKMNNLTPPSPHSELPPVNNPPNFSSSVSTSDSTSHQSIAPESNVTWRQRPYYEESNQENDFNYYAPPENSQRHSNPKYSQVNSTSFTSTQRYSPSIDFNETNNNSGPRKPSYTNLMHELPHPQNQNLTGYRQHGGHFNNPRFQFQSTENLKQPHPSQQPPQYPSHSYNRGYLNAPPHSTPSQSHSNPHPSRQNFNEQNPYLPSNTPNPTTDNQAIIKWLCGCGLQDYVPLFLSHEINYDMIANGELKENDLTSMGVGQLGIRKKIMKAIATETQSSQTLSDGDRNSMQYSNNHFPTVPPMPPSSYHFQHPSQGSAGGVSFARPLNASISPSLNQSPHFYSPSPKFPPPTDSLSLHVSFLHSAPLLMNELPGRSYGLNFQKEIAGIKDSLTESGKAVGVRFAPATKDNLLKLLTLGTKVLHVSGHGDPYHLLLESSNGTVEPLSSELLGRMLVTGGSDLQFVFISSCFSYRAASAFLAAGVKHVIAVQADTQVKDVSAIAFTAHVYLALFQGRSVREAFQKGQAAVLACGATADGSSDACCCAHLHTSACVVCTTCRTPVCCPSHSLPCHAHLSTPCCAPSIPHGEALKFLLLPEDADHSQTLFSNFPFGQWQDLTPPAPPNNLPSLPEHFLGRSRDMMNIISLMQDYRLTAILGVAGVGKGTVARAIGSFVNFRSFFPHGTFVVNAATLINPSSSTSSTFDHEFNILLAKVMKLDVSLLFAESGMSKTSLTTPATNDSIFHQSSNSTANGHTTPLNQLHPNRLQEYIIEHLRSKHLLLILVGLDGIISNPMSMEFLTSYLKFLLDSTLHLRILFTANLEGGSNSSSPHSPSHTNLLIDGFTCKTYTLGPLHPLDATKLFVSRLPRSLLPSEYGTSSSLEELYEKQPIIRSFHGNPRLLQWAADLLHHISLDTLTRLLCTDVTSTSTDSNHAASNEYPLTGAATSQAASRINWVQSQPEWRVISPQAKTILSNFIAFSDRIKQMEPKQQYKNETHSHTSTPSTPTTDTSSMSSSASESLAAAAKSDSQKPLPSVSSALVGLERDPSNAKSSSVSLPPTLFGHPAVDLSTLDPTIVASLSSSSSGGGCPFLAAASASGSGSSVNEKSAELNVDENAETKSVSLDGVENSSSLDVLPTPSAELRLAEVKAMMLLLPDALFSVNPNGIILDCNRPACTLFQYSSDQLINQSINLLVPSSVRSHHSKLMYTAFMQNENREMGKRKAVQGVKSTGELVELSVNLSPMRVLMPDGSYVHQMLCAARDISQRIQLSQSK